MNLLLFHSDGCTERRECLPDQGPIDRQIGWVGAGEVAVLRWRSA